MPKFCPKCGGRIETQTESTRQTKRCPQCGTENQIRAKFCSKDGYRFEDLAHETVTPDLSLKEAGTGTMAGAVDATPDEVPVAAPTRPLPTENSQFGTAVESSNVPPEGQASGVSSGVQPAAETGPARTSSKGLLIGIGVAVSVAVAAGGGYFYWQRKGIEPQSQPVEVPPVPTASRNVQESAARPLPSPSSGSPASTSSLAAAPAIDIEKIRQQVDQRLQSAGFGTIAASVNGDGSVDLKGEVDSKKKREEAISQALSVFGVERVNETALVVAAPPKNTVQLTRPQSPELPNPATSGLPVDPAKLEGELNRALRNSGISGINAQIGDDLSATLKGSTASANDKQRALQIARQFKGVKGVKDRVFVVE